MRNLSLGSTHLFNCFDWFYWWLCKTQLAHDDINVIFMCNYINMCTLRPTVKCKQSRRDYFIKSEQQIWPSKLNTTLRLSFCDAIPKEHWYRIDIDCNLHFEGYADIVVSKASQVKVNDFLSRVCLLKVLLCHYWCTADRFYTPVFTPEIRKKWERFSKVLGN